jgi:hypothetical protein
MALWITKRPLKDILEERSSDSFIETEIRRLRMIEKEKCKLKSCEFRKICKEIKLMAAE